MSNYTYLADGTKYWVMEGNVKPGSGLLVVFRRKTANGQNVTSSFTTLFSVNDHLGSTRVVMDAAGNILERNAYYPFGLQTDLGNDFPNMSSTLTALYPRYINPSATRRDLYNGKEIQTIAGTDYLDYGFRQYDPVTARWMAVDPIADSTYTLSPYTFCLNSPISTIDSIGCNVTDYYNIYGYLLFKTNDGLNTIILVNEASAKELEAKLRDPTNKNKIDNPEFNKRELHILGKTLNEYSEYYKKDRSYNYQSGFNSEYEKAYNGKERSILKRFLFSLVSVIEYELNIPEAGDLQAGQDAAWEIGRSDRKNCMINRLAPGSSLKNNKPLIIIN